ncbi:MAG TPA: hypothetical protein VNC50_14045 [Planctomycetia bacterium]|jgi:hypothetical protein|nr:hypothetical protein [Planctomycetia bacterium]
MSESKRSESFAAPAEMADRYPHWRTGQLLANVAGWADVEIWDAEDERLLAAAREHLQSLTERNPVGARPADAARAS